MRAPGLVVIVLVLVGACGGTEEGYDYRAVIEVASTYQVFVDGNPLPAVMRDGKRVATFARTYASRADAKQSAGFELMAEDNTYPAHVTRRIAPMFCEPTFADVYETQPIVEEQVFTAATGAITHEVTTCLDADGDGVYSDLDPTPR